MLVAQIAYAKLDANAKRQVNALFRYLPDERRGAAQPYDFVTAACWMDDIKSSREYDALRKLHYIDVPSSGDLRAAPKPNALTALESSLSTLRDKRASGQERACALAIVMHVVGDIHQPLHCVERDLGGNTFPITGVPGLEARLRRDGKSVERKQPAVGDNAPVYQRLHAFWDSAYRYDLAPRGDRERVIELPYLGSSQRPKRDRLQPLAASLMARALPTDRRVLGAREATQWIREGNRLAGEFVFKTARGKTPTIEYFARAHDLANERIALAGYRLALLLNAVY